MNSDNHQYSISYTIFILILLFIPSSEPQIYILISSFIIFLYSFSLKKIKKNIYLQLIAYTLVYCAISAIIRNFVFLHNNARDFIELGRFLPTTLFFISIFKFKKLRVINLFDALYVYILIDALISLMQFNDLNFLGILNIVGNFYNSEKHVEISLRISKRALGLSGGPGDHASMILVGYVFMFIGIFKIKNRKLNSLLGIIFALISIVLSQSQTGVVSCLFLTFIIILFFFSQNSLKHKLLSGTITLITCLNSFFLFGYINSNLRYLNTLFLVGLERSSYIERQNKWIEIFNLMGEKPLWLPIGYGKEYFGKVSGAMDSDFVYVLSVYGLLCTIAIVILISCYIFNFFLRFYLRKQISDWDTLLFFLLIGAIIPSSTSAYFMVPKILTIFSLVMCGKYWIDNNKLLKTYNESQ